MAYAVVRTYQGAGPLIDELEKRSDDVENLIRAIKGFIHYALVRSDDGGFSMGIFEDKEGAEESVRRAREFIATNLPDLGVAPEVVQGETVVHLR